MNTPYSSGSSSASSTVAISSAAAAAWPTPSSFVPAAPIPNVVFVDTARTSLPPPAASAASAHTPGVLPSAHAVHMRGAPRPTPDKRWNVTARQVQRAEENRRKVI